MDRLVSLIHSNSITQLMPNPFQIDSDIQIHIQKTKIPISSKTSIKLTISNHHNFRIKRRENSSNLILRIVRAVVLVVGHIVVNVRLAATLRVLVDLEIAEFCDNSRIWSF